MFCIVSGAYCAQIPQEGTCFNAFAALSTCENIIIPRIGLMSRNSISLCVFACFPFLFFDKSNVRRFKLSQCELRPYAFAARCSNSRTTLLKSFSCSSMPFSKFNGQLAKMLERITTPDSFIGINYEMIRRIVLIEKISGQ